MCGIAGIAGAAASLSRIRAMIDALAHRGPDAEGIWLAEDVEVALGHRRLSVIDLSDAAAQPMVDTEAGVSLTYNGEIYNFKEIRQRLGHFDIACLEVAANVKNETGVPVENCGHMQARHTLQAFLDLGAEKLFPVHWSTFELFSHQWDEPVLDLLYEAEQAEIALLTPKIGQTNPFPI